VAVIESAECWSESIATSPLTTAPVVICTQPVAAPAAPAICGNGCIAPCIAFGAISPKAKLPTIRSEMSGVRGIQPTSVISNRADAVATANARPDVNG
jgi:hypothetical protein